MDVRLPRRVERATVVFWWVDSEVNVLVDEVDTVVSWVSISSVGGLRSGSRESVADIERSIGWEIRGSRVSMMGSPGV